jgi:hypothetical protein
VALDLSKTSPADIVQTMRSLPRRFREALDVRSDEDQDQLVRVVGADGSSALDHVAATARMLALFEGALTEVVNGRQPVLHAAVTDPSARSWEQSPSDLDGELSLLDDAAESLAGRVERTSGDQWQAVGRVVGGTELTALDVAKEAVQTAIAGLKATEAAMQAARRR